MVNEQSQREIILSQRKSTRVNNADQRQQVSTMVNKFQQGPARVSKGSQWSTKVNKRQQRSSKINKGQHRSTSFVSPSMSLCIKDIKPSEVEKS